jgi:hypothetical protein
MKAWRQHTLNHFGKLGKKNLATLVPAHFLASMHASIGTCAENIEEETVVACEQPRVGDPT